MRDQPADSWLYALIGAAVLAAIAPWLFGVRVLLLQLRADVVPLLAGIVCGGVGLLALVRGLATGDERARALIAGALALLALSAWHATRGWGLRVPAWSPALVVGTWQPTGGGTAGGGKPRAGANDGNLPAATSTVTSAVAAAPVSVSGTVRWNDAPLADQPVALCERFGLTCGGRIYRARTDAAGRYRFADVLPGSGYVLASETPAGWVTYSSFGAIAERLTVPDRPALVTLPDWEFVRRDVATATPTDGARVPVAAPLTLAWQAYPGAAQYELYLALRHGEALLVSERVTGTSITVDLLPVDCAHVWNVEAQNAAGTPIARTAGFAEFTTTGGAADCRLRPLAPVDGAVVDGRDVALSWTPSPLAAYYQLLMWNDSLDDKPNVVDFVALTAAAYSFDAALPPARYVWNVFAYDADDNQIGATEPITLIVER